MSSPDNLLEQPVTLWRYLFAYHARADCPDVRWIRRRRKARIHTRPLGDVPELRMCRCGQPLQDLCSAVAYVEAPDGGPDQAMLVRHLDRPGWRERTSNPVRHLLAPWFQACFVRVSTTEYRTEDSAVTIVPHMVAMALEQYSRETDGPDRDRFWWLEGPTAATQANIGTAISLWLDANGQGEMADFGAAVTAAELITT